MSPAEAQAAEARLSAAWGERAGILSAEAIQGRTDVFRLRLNGGRSAVLKRRGQGREQGQHGGEAGVFGIELATLEYLNAMPVPVAPRLLGADTEAGILLMEDLGPGPSLADSLLTGEPGQAKAGLIAYARALGRLHAWSRSRGDELAALRARYAPGAALAPAWMGAIERGREAFLGVAAELGLVTDGVEDEISGLGALMSGPELSGPGPGGPGAGGPGPGGPGAGGSGYLGLVHGDACPDNVRLVGGDGRVFDFETSGWGPVVLDIAYLLAPFPSCWCFGAVPAGDGRARAGRLPGRGRGRAGRPGPALGCRHGGGRGRLDHRPRDGDDQCPRRGPTPVGNDRHAAAAARLAAQLYRCGPSGRRASPPARPDRPA